MKRRALLVFLLLPACATVQSGAFEIPARYAEHEFPKLKNRATFDLDCPADQLQVITLNVTSTPAGNQPTEVGVKGCGRKAVYFPKEQAWLMSGSATRSFDEARAIAGSQAASAPPAPPSLPPAP
jgi:hypothetical protein